LSFDLALVAVAGIEDEHAGWGYGELDEPVESAPVEVLSVILDVSSQGTPARGGDLPDSFGLVGFEAGPSQFPHEQSAAEQDVVSDELGRQAEPRSPGQEEVVGIQELFFFRYPGRLAVGCGHAQLLDEPFDVPVVLHEGDGQVIQQLGMRREASLGAEVAG